MQSRVDTFREYQLGVGLRLGRVQIQNDKKSGMKNKQRKVFAQGRETLACLAS